MKYLLILLLFIAPFGVFADQRNDSDTNNCHISPDPNDDDAEIDLACSNFVAEVNRFVDTDGVRKANSFLHGKYRVPLGTARVKHPLLVPHEAGDIFLVGNANTRTLRGDYVTATNTQCDMVRTNYQANTGSDDQNQTEYTTDDWDLTINWLGYEDINGDILAQFSMTDLEFDYNDDGVVDLGDYSLYRSLLSPSNIGVWNIARNCRNGLAQ